jgi:hypothetical protein
MPKQRCPQCQHDVIDAAGPGGALVRLDAHAVTWTSLEERHLFPEEGDAVRPSRALVTHAAVCVAVRAGEARQRVGGRNQYRQRKGHLTSAEAQPH